MLLLRVGDNTLKFVTITILFASLAFSQEVNHKLKKLDPRAAAAAWQSVRIPLPDNTPSVSNAGLILESSINEDEVGKVWMNTGETGTYLILGTACNGDEIKIAEFEWHYPERNIGLVFDGRAFSNSVPFFHYAMCDITMYHVGKAQTERTTVHPNSTPTASQKIQINGEAWTEGRYYFVTNPLPQDAQVFIGRFNKAEIRNTPAGSYVIFPEYIYPTGLTTITMCSKGACTSTAYETRLDIPRGKG